jgi:hypothetical protein
MKFTRFKTDRKWWLGISLVLFLVPWFLPIWDVNDDYKHMPAMIWVILFSHPESFGETLGFICVWAVAFGIPAVSIGWVIHCVAVMIRGSIKRRC